MTVCPICRFDNPPGAAVCGRCGRHRFAAGDDAAAVRRADDGGDILGDDGTGSSLFTVPRGSIHDPIAPTAPPPRPAAAIDGSGSVLQNTLTRLPAAPQTPRTPPSGGPSTVQNAATRPAGAVAANGPPTLVAAPRAEPPAAPAPPPPRPRLVVLRGQRVNAEYPLYEGANYVGRSADQAVDIDLNGQEPPDQVWSSRRHAVVRCDGGGLWVEDLNSLNGTFVNRARVVPGQPKPLRVDDVIQIGTVQLKLVV